jgi:hypothetical protein
LGPWWRRLPNSPTPDADARPDDCREVDARPDDCREVDARPDDCREVDVYRPRGKSAHRPRRVDTHRPREDEPPVATPTMATGDDDPDRLAHDLTETTFDAVERDGLRAEWSDDDTHVVVENLATGESVTYDGEDLIRATSEQELRNARTGAEAVDTGEE